MYYYYYLILFIIIYYYYLLLFIIIYYYYLLLCLTPVSSFGSCTNEKCTIRAFDQSTKWSFEDRMYRSCFYWHKKKSRACGLAGYEPNALKGRDCHGEVFAKKGKINGWWNLSSDS